MNADDSSSEAVPGVVLKENDVLVVFGCTPEQANDVFAVVPVLVSYVNGTKVEGAMFARPCRSAFCLRMKNTSARTHFPDGSVVCTCDAFI